MFVSEIIVLSVKNYDSSEKTKTNFEDGVACPWVNGWCGVNIIEKTLIIGSTKGLDSF